MGRETKILLGLLATLLGVFLGVLSMKLLVPRPPVGAGPDIDTDIASSEAQELVEPPQFDEPTLPREPVLPAAHADRFAARQHAEPPPAEPLLPAARDPFVTRSSFAQPETAVGEAPPPGEPAARQMPTPRRSPEEPSFPSPTATAAMAPPPVAGTAYVARDGDSWWSLAESVYGDGRFYRALFAWNRAVDPRVSLVPGTSLELPSRDRLQTAWPALVPAP